MYNVKEIISLMSSPSSEEIDLINKAYSFAENAHKDYKRYSGEPYFVHVFETAKILAEFGLRGRTIAAGLLHDTVEDTDVKPEEIEKEFGSEILFLVEGVTKLGKVRYRGLDRHNESLRKLFVATAKDIRVIIIKLADRLHSIQTLEHVPERKQIRIAKETLDIYAPIAYRLGIQRLHRKLEDGSFPYVYPEEHKEIKKIFDEQRKDSEKNLKKIHRSIVKELTKHKINLIKINYRVKGLYSLYLKYLRKNRDINQIYDILAIRIIVPTVSDCYSTLGVVHGSWRPMPNRIKDYISFEKPNGYQSLHTTIFTGDGNVLEIQIKTEEMHREAEFGIASHLAYKEGSVKGGKSWISALMPFSQSKEEETSPLPSIKDQPPYWLKDILKNDSSYENTTNFVDSLKGDLFKHRIFVFTPKGDVIDLPIDASPIDFAYAIHSNIGDRISGVKVNDKMVSLEKTLKNGDIVEIKTKESSKPTEKWLRYAKTSLAQRHIRNALTKTKKSSHMYSD